MNARKQPLTPQFLRTLQTPQGRSHSGLYLVEGIRHVARAVEEEAIIHSIFLSPCDLANPFGQKLARKLRKSGIPSSVLTPRVYRDLTLAVEPQGLGAVIQQDRRPLPKPKPGALYLAVEDIESPGNLGTIMRTAECAGVEGIILLNSDPYDPAAVRASMGALFSQRLIRTTGPEFVSWARRNQVALVGSSPAGMLSYRNLPSCWPAVLVIGSEKKGLSQALVEACDFMVRIPMAGRSDSINAAVAAGVLMYEFFHQRELAGPGNLH